MAIPTKPADLATWSTNFQARATESPITFGLSSAQCVAYTALHDPFIAAWQAASAVGARSKSLVTARDDAAAALLEYARQLYGFIQANMAVSDADKNLIGVAVRSAPVPQPAPGVAPAMDVVSVDGNTVNVRLHDAAGEGKRSKPAGVKGAAVFSFVGEEAPNDPSLFKFEGNTTRSLFSVSFPLTVTPGSTVWLCAMWFNAKAQSGPACTPISTTIQFGGGMMSKAA